MREKSKDPSFLPHLLFRKYISTDEKWTIESSSIFNIFMNAWAETGIFGVVAIAGILFTVIIRGFLGIWKTRCSETGTPLRFLLPLFLAILLAHQTIYLWCHPWLWTIIALTYASSEVSHSHVNGSVQ